MATKNPEIYPFFKEFSADKPILKECISKLISESPITYEHTVRVVRTSLPVISLYLDPEFTDISTYADTIHDMGKISIPEVNATSDLIDRMTLEKIRTHMENLKPNLDDIKNKVGGDDNGLTDKAYRIAMTHHDILPTDLFNQTYYPRKFSSSNNGHQPLEEKNEILMALILSLADKASRIGVFKKNIDHMWKEKIFHISIDDVNLAVVDPIKLRKIFTNNSLQILAQKIWESGESLT